MMNVLVLAVGAALAAGPAYEEVQVTDGGRVTGRVRLTTPPPARAPLKVEKDVPVCGATQPDITYVVGAEGALANVVVVIDGVTRGKPLGKREALLDQKGCRFTPRVLAFPKGTKLEIRSSDPTLHNTHVQRGGKDVFNVALPVMDMKVTKKLKEPGVHAIGCDVHTFMKGWVFVTEHPYVTVTDAQGRFELADVPPGTYRLRAWHEAAGEKPLEAVVVTGGGTATVEILY
ncbi:MAG: carboxypeptidase regulatory-like domain-containing protein [Myxococcaceae bacterium]